MADDTLAAELAAIKLRRAQAEIGGLLRPTVAQLDASAEDVPRLLAVADALLEPHKPGRRVITGHLCKPHRDYAHFSIDAAEAADVAACPDCKATVYACCAGCGEHAAYDSCPVRARAARALAGKVGADV